MHSYLHGMAKRATIIQERGTISGVPVGKTKVPAAPALSLDAAPEDTAEAAYLRLREVASAIRQGVRCPQDVALLAAYTLSWDGAGRPTDEELSVLTGLDVVRVGQLRVSDEMRRTLSWWNDQYIEEHRSKIEEVLVSKCLDGDPRHIKLFHDLYGTGRDKFADDKVKFCELWEEITGKGEAVAGAE